MFTPCKINLGLNVVRKRTDGYHDLETVFYPIPIYDTLEVKPLDGKTADCRLVVDGVPDLCPVQQNLVYKAYMLLAERYPMPPVETILTKVIPSQAGMGGGSSDAAAMLVELNRQLKLGISKKMLQEFAAQLGADCAFFVDPVPCYATGIGDILSPIKQGIPALKDKWIALVKPSVAVSTKEAYAGITPRQAKENCLDIVMQPIETWRDRLINDFEESIFPLLPQLSQVKQTLYDKGAIYAAMSGSGSTVFGIYQEEPRFIEATFPDCFTAIKRL